MSDAAPQGASTDEPSGDGGGEEEKTVLSPSEEYEQEFNKLLDPDKEEDLDEEDEELELDPANNEDKATGKKKASDESDSPPDTAPDDTDWKNRFDTLRQSREGTKREVAERDDRIAELEAKLLENKASDKNPGDDTDENSDGAEKIQGFEDYVKNLPDEGKALFEDNPELAKAFGGYFSSIVDKLQPKAKDEDSFDKRYEEKRSLEREEEKKVEFEHKNEEFQERVREEIDGFEDIINDPEFQDWRDSKSAQVNAILAKHDQFSTKGVKEILGLFGSEKKFNAETAEDRKHRLGGFKKSPRSKSSSPDPKPSDDDYDSAFAFYEKQAKNK